MENYSLNIGSKVIKCRINKDNSKKYNPKRFKSGLKINTVKDVIDHPHLHIPAYTFIEDDSYVECRRCEVVNYTKEQQRIFDYIERHSGTTTVQLDAGIGKSKYVKARREEIPVKKKLSQFQIDMIVSLYEGSYFNATAYRTINVLESRGLIENTIDNFWKITNKGINELNLVRPL